MFADIGQETVTTFWMIAGTLFVLVLGLTIRAGRKRRRKGGGQQPGRAGGEGYRGL